MQTEIALGRVTPVLRIFDEAKAREFYLEFLGFTMDWEHRFEPGLPLYAQVSRGETTLHLSEHFGDGTPGTRIRIEVGNIEAFQRQLLDRRYRNSRPALIRQEWGEISMTIPDPFGNDICFFERISDVASR